VVTFSPSVGKLANSFSTTFNIRRRRTLLTYLLTYLICLAAGARAATTGQDPFSAEDRHPDGTGGTDTDTA